MVFVEISQDDLITIEALYDFACDNKAKKKSRCMTHTPKLIARVHNALEKEKEYGKTGEDQSGGTLVFFRGKETIALGENSQ